MSRRCRPSHDFGLGAINRSSPKASKVGEPQKESNPINEERQKIASTADRCSRQPPSRRRRLLHRASFPLVATLVEGSDS